MPALPEAQVICSLCRQGVPPSAYEYHLRQVHRLFTYRGVRRSAEETVEVLLPEVVTPQPSADAWESLWHLCNDAYAERGHEALAGVLGDALARLPDDRRQPVLTALAPLAARPGLVAALARSLDVAARTLALAALAQPGLPPDADTLRPLLADRRLSSSLQRHALARLWPSLTDEALANQLLDDYTAGHGQKKSFGLLRALQKHTGPHPLLAARSEELQGNARLVCSRCGVELRRPAMEQHVWVEHRLILDGLKTRDPWHLIEEWLEAVRHDPAAGWLAHCRVAAEKIDPDGGPLRLARLACAHGVNDPDSRRKVLALARERHAACCPWCYALVNVPDEEPFPPINLRPGRLSSRGFEVRTDERGFQPQLHILSPAGPVYQGREPGREWTVRGIADLVALPLVVLALLFACFWPVKMGAVKGVFLLVVLAALASVAVRLYGLMRHRRRTTVPLLGYAWRYLVPRLHGDGFRREDSAFAAGLAQAHAGRGLDVVESAQLARLLRLAEPAAKKGEVPAAHLAALCRLKIEKEAETGRDPVPLVVELMARTFEGQLPFSFAQKLLEDWAAKWWTKKNLARLRVLLCDRAFEAGFEVQSLLDAGQNAPALGVVLGTAEPRSLAALRLLWSLRPTRPWDRLGAVMTAFELAADPDLCAPLGEQPDLLLCLTDRRWTLAAENGPIGPAVYRLTTLGVWLQDVLFRVPPREVEVKLRSTRCQMVLGAEVFFSTADLEPVSRDLDRWFRYSFHEFLPGVDRALTWTSPDRAAILRAWGAVPCPECGKHLLPRAGEVGIALDERP